MRNKRIERNTESLPLAASPENDENKGSVDYNDNQHCPW